MICLHFELMNEAREAHHLQWTGVSKADRKFTLALKITEIKLRKS
jgi:hypothetical protein